MPFPDPAKRLFAVCRTILWLASWLAPARQRAEWRVAATRQAWHWCLFLAETGRLNRGNKLELARFCWSAFPAAFWLRFDRDEFLRRKNRLFGSPSFCLSAIAVAVI